MNTYEELVKWRNRLDLALTTRNRLVVQMREEGATLREIADAAGLTPPGVARILKRAKK